ncbi:hypothetical protein GZH49_12150 [Nocardia terpenica]|uniref:hypothetical protein n=1 Tax=Nocardia terpenica TaxID=455432 RepID=UPI002FE06F24
MTSTPENPASAPADGPDTAVDILTARARRAAEFYPHDRRAREAFERHCARAIRLARHADRVLHACWQTIDHAQATGQPYPRDIAIAPRAVQESVIADWAWAHADPRSRFTSPEFAADMDIQLTVTVHMDPDALRALVYNTIQHTECDN